MSGKAFKRRLVHIWCCVNNYNFVPLLKNFIANVLKCKGHLKAKFKWMFARAHNIKGECPTL